MDDTTIEWARLTIRCLTLRKCPGLTHEHRDIESFVMIECLKAEPRFKSDRGACLRTFLERRIRGALKDYFRERQRMAGVTRMDNRNGITDREHVPVELVQIPINPESSQIEARLTTDRLLSALREKDRYAVVSYFFAGLKLKEIGRRLGVSEGRVSQRVNNSLRLMRQNGISVRRPDGP